MKKIQGKACLTNPEKHQIFRYLLNIIRPPSSTAHSDNDVENWNSHTVVIFFTIFLLKNSL